MIAARSLRRAVALLCVGAVALVPAACGGGDDDDGAPSASTTDQHCIDAFVALGQSDEVLAAAGAHAASPPTAVADYADECADAFGRLTQAQLDDASARIDQAVLAYLGPALRAAIDARGTSG